MSNELLDRLTDPQVSNLQTRLLDRLPALVDYSQ